MQAPAWNSLGSLFGLPAATTVPAVLSSMSEKTCDRAGEPCRREKRQALVQIKIMEGLVSLAPGVTESGRRDFLRTTLSGCQKVVSRKTGLVLV